MFSEGSLSAEGAFLAEGSFSAKGSLCAEGSFYAEGSLCAEGSFYAEGSTSEMQFLIETGIFTSSDKTPRP